MTTKAQIKFTYEDYKSMTLGERERFELLEGELIPMAPSPGFAHQSASLELATRLHLFAREKKAGIVIEAPFDVVLGVENVVQPDILFISQGRQQIIHEDGIHGAPDLVVEVLSPATAEKDRLLKRKLYAKYGVREYWIVDPQAKTIEVLTLGEQGYERAGLFQKDETLESPILAGLRILLSEIF